jgi:hypothetical protein
MTLDAIDYRITEVRSKIQLAAHEFHESMVRAQQEFDARYNEIWDDIEHLEAELEAGTVAYTERYDYATLLLDQLLADLKAIA